MKDDGFQQRKKGKNKRYPKKTMTDAEYAGDLALRANTTVLAEYLPRSLEQTVRCISLNVK